MADTASDYNVIIIGDCSNDTSANVSLAVNAATAITIPPTGQTACVGSVANYSVTAVGTVLSYQWRKGTVNLTNGGNISGADISMLTINSVSVADTATDYNVIIIGACSNDTSANVSLSLCPTGIAIVDAGKMNQAVTIYPSPFMTSINIKINNASMVNGIEFLMYNILGDEVMNTMISGQSTNLKTTGMPSGIYFYRVMANNKVIQSGKLISQQ
jgi:hypothetical protein